VFPQFFNVTLEEPVVAKQVSLCILVCRGSNGAETLRLKKKIIAILEQFGGRRIKQRRSTYGSHAIDAEFKDRDTAVRTAVECDLIGTDAGYAVHTYVDCEKLEIFPNYWAANSREEIDLYRDDQAVLGLVTYLWKRYRDIGGQLSRTEFVYDCMATEGGVDRVYFEEGLKPAFAQ
jgi:hypothetical protein